MRRLYDDLGFAVHLARSDTLTGAIIRWQIALRQFIRAVRGVK